MKTCPRCQETKPKTEFVKHKNRKDGLAPYCRPCARLRTVEYRERIGKEAYNVLQYQWWQKNKERAKRYRRKSTLKRSYGLTIEQYEEMVQSQGGNCAVCLKPPNDILYVDHDHATGRVRKLLCQSCNFALGLLEEDVERISRLIDYITAHREATEGVS